MTTQPLPTEYVGRRPAEIIEVCRRCVGSPLHRLAGQTRYCPRCGWSGPEAGHCYRLEEKLG